MEISRQVYNGVDGYEVFFTREDFAKFKEFLNKIIMPDNCSKKAVEELPEPYRFLIRLSLMADKFK